VKGPLLSIQNLTVIRNGNVAIHNLDLNFEAGKTVAILGANGAGKSTLLRTVIGLEQPDDGEMYFGGIKFTSLSTRHRAQLGIGYCPEGRQLFPGLTVLETLSVAFRGSRAKRSNRICEIFDFFPALKSKQFDRTWSLSGGQQQQLVIACAIMNRPKIVLLDEPTLGLAPMTIKGVEEIISNISSTGTGVILCEQNAGSALRLADRLIILISGRVAYDGLKDGITPDRIGKLLLTGK